MNTMLALSLAGHDKGKIYVIIKEEKEQAYLSDGEFRPLDKLKIKNKKHIQIIKYDVVLAERATNEEIKYNIKQFMQK